MSSAAIKAVHVCRRQVKGLEEEDAWRDFLQVNTGKRSLREMTEAELGKVIDTLRRDGATAKGKPSSKAHVRKIFAIWSDMCRQGIPQTPTKEALRAFARNMTGVSDPNWLTPKQAQQVTEGLKAWKAREVKKRAEATPAGEDGSAAH